MLKMPMKSAELQAYYLRKREIEHQRAQKSQAVSQYYDHWGKVTSRHENWTTPEYYQQAEEKANSLKSAREKKKEMEVRQSRMRELFGREMESYEVELKQIERKKGNRFSEYATDILRKTEERLKQEENVRRKLEMEAKLYGKWRYGVEDEELLFKSKSDNQVLAKLNWLDKQIEEQMEKEKQAAQAKENALKFQEETRKIEEIQRQRQMLREKEINDLRSMQTVAMEKLQEYKNEAELLRSREEELKFIREELLKEREILDNSTANTIKHADYDFRFSQKKVKTEIRNRSEDYRKQLQLMIDVLERLGRLCPETESTGKLVELYKMDLEKEALAVPQFEAMYESEAKQQLLRLEAMWQQQTLARYKTIKDLLEKEFEAMGHKLDANLTHQNELVDLRSTLLNSVDASNEKLRSLVDEEAKEAEKREAMQIAALDLQQEEVEKPKVSPRDSVADIISGRNVSLDNPRNSSSSPQVATQFLQFSESNQKERTRKQFDQMSDTFSNLNFGSSNLSENGRSLPLYGAVNPTRAVVTPDNVEMPKFGRKRVAWT